MFSLNKKVKSEDLKWICEHCSVENESHLIECHVCITKRTSNGQQSDRAANLNEMNEQ